MLPERVSNPRPLTYESGALRGPAGRLRNENTADGRTNPYAHEEIYVETVVLILHQMHKKIT